MEKNYFVQLSSKNLFNLVNIFCDFKVFISYIIDKNKGKEKDDLFEFSEAIKEQILTKFKINNNDLEEILNSEEKNENKYKEFYEKK